MIEKAREDCLRSFHESCTEFVHTLEAGQGCSNTKSETRDNLEKIKMERFNCSSLLLGNTLLALREYCGPHWNLCSTWSDSIELHRETLRKVSNRLDGPNHIIHSNQSESFGSYSSRIHSTCSMSDKFIKSIETAYKAAYDTMLSDIRVKTFPHFYPALTASTNN